MKRCTVRLIIQNINIDINNNVNSHNLNEVFNEFVKDYNSKNRSIISNEFYGFFNSQSVCGYCNNIVHNVFLITL